MEELKKGISRRNLLKGATLSAAGVAALGMFGCSPAGGSSSSSSKSDAAAGEKKHTWEVAPEAITDIAETVETEVLVIGAGYAGTCCALNAAQNGTKVTLVEKDGVPNGHGVGGTGAIASKALDALDIHFDKSIEMERWVSTCGNRCRESLVAKWFRESERCMNWLLDLAETDGAKCMVTVGSNSTVHPEIDCYHMIFGGNLAKENEAISIATYIEYLFIAKAEETGNFELVYNMPAQQLVTNDKGEVTGAICKNEEGKYVQYNASKGVVLATGDVSYNDEYINEFAPIANKVMTRLCSDQGNTGDGHNMAAWVGGAFQDGPWPTMMHPQAAAMYHGPFLFVNPKGKRFMNEATWVQGKCVGTMVNGGADHCWSIFDSNFEADNTASLEFGGGMFWDSFRAVGTTAADASASHAKTVKEGVEKTPDNYKVADTIDELLKQLDVDVDEAKKTPTSTRNPISCSPSSRAPSTQPRLLLACSPLLAVSRFPTTSRLSTPRASPSRACTPSVTAPAICTRTTTRSTFRATAMAAASSRASASANSSRASTRSSRSTNEPSAGRVGEMQLGIANCFESRSEAWRRYASDKRKARCGARLRPTAT